ncbi:CidA/LrgA family protein [Cohnella nanjingensis]|uniref:CidA/LrgA family protein n=1 Tax=Cohnella nanjingensis TaxID=1387779 RepID=A0A7X0VEU6_9BACL|nr:CidA/LrgA family protein [Cohnella nanjingensis]MBB6671380.1 CidA/LrgA family protein [Cohnella nanjingensis]
MRSFILTGLQIAALIALSRLADAAVRFLHLPVPGSIVGIGLLFVLLRFRIVRPQWVERGAKWLIAEMLLFFIPAAVGIVQYKQLVVTSGFRIAATILLSTLAVMLCAGWIGERMTGRQRREGKTSS